MGIPFDFLSINVVEDVLPIVWYSLNLPVDRFMVYVPAEVCDAIFVLKSKMMFPFRTSIPFAFACIPANRAQHARSIIPGSLFLFIFCNCSDYIFSFILTLASSPAIITMMREYTSDLVVRGYRCIAHVDSTIPVIAVWNTTDKVLHNR